MATHREEGHRVEGPKIKLCKTRNLEVVETTVLTSWRRMTTEDL